MSRAIVITGTATGIRRHGVERFAVREGNVDRGGVSHEPVAVRSKVALRRDRHRVPGAKKVLGSIFTWTLGT